MVVYGYLEGEDIKNICLTSQPNLERLSFKKFIKLFICDQLNKLTHIKQTKKASTT